MAFFELRTYTIKTGCREQWEELMDKVVIPFQIKMGMTVIGRFVDLEHDDLYVWIRRFEDEDQRKRLYDAVYNSETWLNEIKPGMGDMLIREKIVVQLLKPSKGSEIQ